MTVETEEHPDRAFGASQVAAFGWLIPVIEAFAETHGFRLSRSFDQDPTYPYACYFILWPMERCRPCSIRICAADPFAAGNRFFQIDAVSQRRVVIKGQTFESLEGRWRLELLLEEARRAVEKDSPLADPASV